MSLLKNTQKTLLIGASVLLMVFSIGCDYAATTAPDAPVSMKVVQADEINWVSWNAEAVKELEARDGLFKGDDDDEDQRGYAEKEIENDEGGRVGGRKTFGNKVRLPEGALQTDEAVVSVEVMPSVEENGWYDVEFRVDDDHYTFEKNVRITLSYKHLDLNGVDPKSLTVYWYEDNPDYESGWVPVEDLRFNTDRKKVTFKIDHFTRYGWAF